MKRLIAAVALLPILFAAYPTPGHAAGIAALKVFEGNWRGKGRLVVKDGRPPEAIVCRTSGKASSAAFTISGRCGGGSYTGTFSITIRAAGKRYTGQWRSARSKGPVAFSGRGGKGTFRFHARGGKGGLASIAIRSQGSKRFRLSASGRGKGKKTAGNLTITFTRR